jgi:glycosyltransferase involved in cell wall biosynthesis
MKPVAAPSIRDSRPGLAIISNEQTPYRLHLHRRIATELPELRLWSLFTHEKASSPWKLTECPEINPVWFGAGDSSQDQAKLSHAIKEWRKGGAILRWMQDRDIRAVVVLGYNDWGRWRILQGCRRRGIPCLLFGDSNILCDNPSGAKALLKRALLPRILKRCSGVLYCGRLGREYFIRYGADPARMFPFPYEPDYQAVQDVPLSQIEQARRRYHLPAGRRYLIYSGRLTPVKRVDLLLHAFAAIAADRPHWDLIMAGDGELRASLPSLVPADLKPRVIWTGFIDDHQRLAALYALADVLVLPSEYEPWGVVVTEAAVRLALVASSVVGAAAEVLRDGVNGKLFENRSLPSLIAALREVTDESRIDAFKAASPKVLAEWRKRSDPVAGLRQALESVGALPVIPNR